MKPTIDLSRRFRSLRLLCAAVGACALIASAGAAAQEKPAPAPAAAQKTFATAQEAADALIAAAESFDRPALKAILGPDGDYLVAPGEPAKDRETAMAFAAKAREKTRRRRRPEEPEPRHPHRRRPGLAAPDPDRPEGRAWRFDSEAGRQEILHRTIGRNELDAIEICRGYVEAQHEYALVKHEGSSVNQYAQRDHQLTGKAGRPGVAERRTARGEGPSARTSPGPSSRATPTRRCPTTATSSRSSRARARRRRSARWTSW